MLGYVTEISGLICSLKQTQPNLTNLVEKLEIKLNCRK